jgi:hypothetical protein
MIYWGILNDNTLNMVITQEQAKHLDLILSTLLNKEGTVYDVETINSKLIPDKSYDYCLSLFYILANFPQRLLWPKDNLSEEHFWATDYVKVFLHDGGFTSLYERAEAKQKIESEKERLNLEKLKYDVRNTKRIYKTYWLTFGVSIAGFLLALGKIIFDLLSKK